jgi:hypothetical protein
LVLLGGIQLYHTNTCQKQGKEVGQKRKVMVILGSVHVLLLTGLQHACGSCFVWQLLCRNNAPQQFAGVCNWMMAEQAALARVQRTRHMCKALLCVGLLCFIGRGNKRVTYGSGHLALLALDWVGNAL